MTLKRIFAGTAVAAMLAAGGAVAGSIPYPNSGTENPVVYTFTATSDGDIMAYFAGSGASYDEEVGMLVNGVSTGVVGLDNHSSSLGQVLDLGFAHAGDVLTFVDYIFTTGDTWYSDPSLNTDGDNHVYSTDAYAGQVSGNIPAGVYVGFEDLPHGASDYNYFDDTFVFTDVSAMGVPEPATWAMLLAGFGLLGAGLRLRPRPALA